MSHAKKNICILGLDCFNREQVEAQAEAKHYDFCSVASFDRLQNFTEESIESILDRIRYRINEAKVDGLATWWDFPGTLLLGRLNDEFDFQGPGLEAILRCEHKYWSRKEQAKVIPEAVPEFDVINPFDATEFDQLPLSVPFWMKPVKATESMLGFRINSAEDYAEALKKTRESIREIARPFNEILSYASLPKEIEAIDGHHCLLEEESSGSQHTVCGYVSGGKIKTYGVVDSLNYPETTSFLCYAYPSTLPQGVADRMCELSKKVIGHLGLKQSAFNIEYFYDESSDTIHLLEINPRISQSHGNIFHKVDGKSDELLIMELALGEDPDFPEREGDYDCAAKFYLRTVEDGQVERVPTAEEVESIQDEFPGMLLQIEVEEGERLSDALMHDSYSYVLAIFFLGAENREALHAKFDTVSDRLNFKIQR